MLKILGLILGFIILILSAIGLSVESFSIDEETVPKIFDAFEDGCYDEEILSGWCEDLSSYEENGIAGAIGITEAIDVTEENAVAPELGIAEDNTIGGIAALPEESADEIPGEDPEVINEPVVFGNSFSMSVPSGMVWSAYDENGTFVIAGYSEDTEQAFLLRRITPKKPAAMEDLEAICSEILEDVEYHTAGDLIYLTGYDPLNMTDMCILTDSSTSDIYVIGISGCSPDMPAARFFQTLDDAN